MGRHHPVTWLTWINFGMAISIMAVSLYYVVRGRQIDKKLMIYNFASGVVLVCFYCLIFYDILIRDIVTMKQASAYILKPLYFFTLFTLLWNIVRIGSRDDI